LPHREYFSRLRKLISVAPPPSSSRFAAQASSCAPAGVLGSGEHALGVELGPEPDRMPRLIIRAD